MTTEERELLTRFLAQLTSIPGGAKDAEADRLIEEAAQQQPDALYLLTQKALLQERGLQRAQSRIEALEAQVEALNRPRSEAAGTGGFLNRDPWAAPPKEAVPPEPPAQRADAPPVAERGGFAAPIQSPGSGFGSFLGSAAATAAGVAGGAFLFHQLNSLGHSSTDWGHHHRGEESLANHAQEPSGWISEPESHPESGYGENSPVAFEEWPVFDEGFDDGIDV